MIEKLFLICNAHLDPVWQWEWEEGAAEALSTFRIAAKFCEEYDGFVFCHNEALLYQWVEAYEPELFTRIQKLVKQKKWHIMGGWYLQPDCNMPSGEGFVRQILTGKKYFLEKFGVSPSTAVNVDPFGHSRGLVQIMKKCGYNGYLFMRPGDGDRYIKLPADEFKWIGYDASEIIAVRIDGSYNSSRGCAAKKVRVIEDGEVRTVVEALFGYHHSYAVVRYIISETGDLEVKLHMLWNEKQKLVKMNVPSVLKEAECMGEQAYGQELLNPELEENISQKYQVLYSGEKGILIVNNGVYGSSFCGEEGTLKITLLRSPSYCAHPIPGRTTMPQDRYMPYIDQGEHDFSFLFRFGTKEKMLWQASRTAQEFQAPPMLLSCYPPEKSGEKNAPVQLLHTDTIQFVTLKKAEDGEYFFVRLFNPTDKEQSAVLHFQDKKEELNFEKYEIKTIRCSCREVIETELQI